MAASYTQDTLPITLTTPLGKDKLLLRSLTGEERISGLFRFSLEMVAENDALDLDALLGQHMTVTFHLKDGAERHLNGVVGRIAQGDTERRLTTYYAELHPWLWLLTLTSDSRIFQHQTVPQIIEQVFTDLGFTDYRNDLRGTYQEREYCVQYQESAFAFVSRLMEDEGIHYFFAHTNNQHVLVLADDADAHQMCPGLAAKTIRYRKSATQGTDEFSVRQCRFERQVVTGKYAVNDFNFETPSTDLIVGVSGHGSRLRVYEYPGGFSKKDAGEKKVRVRIEAHEWPGKMLRGEGSCRAFTTGHKFKLTEHDRAEVNDTWVLHRITHHATQESYLNLFEAWPAAVPFRPACETPRPVIAGSQTAVVVGKNGEEIWTDKYGRIKVQFHWDQTGKSDEHSSCWMRVNQGWAGKQWGSVFLPRIGQEVIVSYLEGNPDRPIVTGAVYNAEQTVPYPLPAEQTKSTIKSNSSKGGAGFNELRFEDKKNAEEIFMHAQKDMNIEVEHDRKATVRTGNETLIVEQGNRTVQVSKGNETHEVKGTRALTVTGNETHTCKADFKQDVSGNYTLKVAGNLTIDVSGSVSIKAGTSLKNEAGTSLTNKAGTALENEAGTSLTSKGNASQTVESGGVVTIKGSLVKLN